MGAVSRRRASPSQTADRGVLRWWASCAGNASTCIRSQPCRPLRMRAFVIHPDDLLALFAAAADAHRDALSGFGDERRAGPIGRAVPARRRRGRCRPRGAARGAGAGGERGVGVERERDAADHRGRRPGRRLHELLARHPVLGHLAVRGRCRRPAVRDGREHATGERSPRCAKRARARRRGARASSTTSGWTTRWWPSSACPDRVLPWKQFRALGSAALALCDVARGRARRLSSTPARPARGHGITSVACSCAREAGATSSTCTTVTSSSPTPRLAASGCRRDARAGRRLLPAVCR